MDLTIAHTHTFIPLPFSITLSPSITVPHTSPPSQMVMSFLKFGFITVFLSDSLVSGYTAAAAFTIMITQIKFLFGLPAALAAIPSGAFVTPKVSQL